MSGTPLSELSSAKTMAGDDQFRLFPLKSGPHFGDASLSNGASGVVFTGYTKDASIDNDAFSCCGNYTLRNSVHAAIAATTPDGCTMFALKSVIDQRPCLAVGGFDRDGKPVTLTPTQFDRITKPLFNFASNVSPILGSEPAPGIQLRSGNSTYGFQYNARSERYIFTYDNRIAGGYHSDRRPDFEAKHNLSLEHDGRDLSKVSLGGSVRSLDRSISASAFREATSSGIDTTVRNGDLYGSFMQKYVGTERTRRVEIGDDRTSIFHEKTTSGKVSAGLQHQFDVVTLKVTRTRDRVTGTEYVLTFTFQLP